MTSTISRIRLRAAVSQGFRCYYCGLPMWDANPADFAATHRLSPGQIPLLRCTAEHLHARVDGGGNTSDNIAAACWFCNRHRHMARKPLPSQQYRVRVERKMRQGKWLAAILPAAISPRQTQDKHDSRRRA